MAIRKTAEIFADGVADDEMPELTPEMVRKARSFSDLLEARGIKRPGRPPSVDPKVRITIRLDADVVEHFKRKGAGWQTRLNEALTDVVEAEKRPRQQPRTGGFYAKRTVAKAAKAAPAKKAAPKAAAKAAPKAPAKKAPARKTAKASPSLRMYSARGKLTA